MNMALIHVAVRCRPLIKREKDQNESIKWGIKGNTICQLEGTLKHGGAYVFDNVFDDRTTNDDLYGEIAAPIISSSMEGFHGTIFAYGQTASGKTFTMMGSEESPGVIPMTVHQIFECIENTPNREFLVRVSYMEIYNESVSDLLGDCTKTLDIREDKNGSVFVKNLTEEMVQSPTQILEVMKKGESNRHFGKTNMNERSSRSHTIFRIIIESKEVGDGGVEDYAVNVSHLNLVDLAGSEKAKQTGASGQRLAEGNFINKSLLTLGQVISQLSETAGFISYRDSKLTRILQNSLGGNSKTAIICNITPANIDETHSTLRFASSAKKIQNKPKVNEVISNEAMLKRYRNTIADLEKELNTYKTQESMAMSQLKVDRQEQIQKLRDLFVVSTKQREVKTRMKRRETWCPGRGLASFAPPGVHMAGLDLASGGLADALPFGDGPRKFRKPAKKEIISKFELVEEEDFEMDLENERDNFRKSLTLNQSLLKDTATIGCQTDSELAKEIVLAIQAKCVHDKSTSTPSPPDVTAKSSQTLDLINDTQTTQDSSDKLGLCLESVACQTTQDLYMTASAASQTSPKRFALSMASQTTQESSALESAGNRTSSDSSDGLEMVSSETQTEQLSKETIACQTAQEFQNSESQTLSSNLVSIQSQTDQHSLENVSVGSQTESSANDTEADSRFKEVEKLSEDLMAHLESEKNRNEKLENDMKNLLFDKNKLIEDLEKKDADFKELETYTRWEGDFKNQSVLEKEGTPLEQNPDLLAEIDMYKSQVAKLTEEKQQLKQWYEEAAKDGIQAQEELMDGKDVIDRLENELEEKTKLIAEYLDNKDEHSRIQDQDLDSLDKEIQSAKLEEASEQISNLQEQIESIITDFTQKESNYEMTMNELKEKNEQLVKENRDKQGNDTTIVKEMQEKVDELMEELTQTETKHQIEVEKLKMKIEELQELAECSLHVDENERIERIIMEKEEYESRVSELEAELCELKKVNENVQSDDTMELIQMKLEKEKYDQEIEKLNMALCELTSDKSLMEDHVKELCQTIEELKGENVSIKSEKDADQIVESLTAELHELKSDKASMEKHIKELALIIDELKEERESQEQKCELYREEVLSLKAEIQRYKSQTESVKTKKGSEEECLLQQLHKERENHDELRSKYEKLLTECATSKGKLLSETNKDLDQQRRLEEMEKARRESIALFSQRSQEQALEIDGLHHQIHDLKSQLQKASGERELAVHHEQKAQEEIDKLKGELRALDDLQKLHEAESKRHDKDPEKMMDKIKKMGVRLDLTNQRCQNYELKNKELEAKAKKVDCLIHEKNNLQYEVRDLNQSLKKLQEENLKLQNTSINTQSQLANVQLQLDMAQHQLEKIKTENNIMNEKLSHLDQNKEENEKQKTVVAEELKKVTFENQTLQRDNSKLREEIEDLQQQVNNGISEEAIEDLIKSHEDKLKNSVAEAIQKTQEEEKKKFSIQLENKLKEENENAETELENQILAIRDQVLAKQMEERTQLLTEHSQEINLMQTEHHTTLEEMKNEQEKTLQSLHEEHVNEVATLTDSISELEIKYKACFEELEETADKLEKALAEKEAFEKEHEEDIRLLRNEIEDIQKAQLQKPHQELLEEQKSQHQIEIQGLQEKHEKLVADIEKMNLQMDDCDRKLKETESNLEKVTQEKEKLEENHKELIKTLEEEKADQSHIDELKSLHQTEIKTLLEAHEEEIQTLQTKHHNEVEDLIKKHADESERTNNTHKEEIDLLKQCIEEGDQCHQGEIEQLKNKHRIAFEEASASHLSEILEIQSEHATEMDNLKEQHKQEIELKLHGKVDEEEVEVLRRHLSEAQVEIETLKKEQFNETKISDNLKAEEELDLLKGCLNEAQVEMDVLKEKHNTEIELLKSQQNDAQVEMDVLKENHNTEIELLKSQQVKVEEELEFLRACLTEAQAEREAVEKEHEAYVQKSQNISDSGLQSQRVEAFDDKRVIELEAKLKEEQALKEKSEEKLSECRNALGNIKMQYHEKKRKLEKKAEMLQNRITILEDGAGQALLDEIKDLKEERDGFKKEAFDAQLDINDLEDKIFEIREERDRLEIEVQRSKGQEVSKLIERIKELEAADTDISWYKKCCDEADEELETLKAEMAAKEKQYKEQLAKAGGGSDVLISENKELKKMVAECKMKIVGLEAKLLTAKDPLKQRIHLLEEDLKQKDDTVFHLKNEIRRQRNEMSAEDSICIKPTKSALPGSRHVHDGASGRSVHDGHSGIVLNEKVYYLEAEKFKLERQLKQLGEENRMLKKNICAEKTQKPKCETPRRTPLRETDVTKKDMATQWEAENSPARLMPRLPREPGYEQFYLDGPSPPMPSPKDGCAQQ